MSNIFAQMEAASAPMPPQMPTTAPMPIPATSLYDIKEVQGRTIERLEKVRTQLSKLEDKLFGGRPPSAGECSASATPQPKKGHLLEAYDNANESKQLADEIHHALGRILAAL